MGAEQKVVVITGASQGIGAKLVRAFLGRGYRVVANSRSIRPEDSADVLAVAGDIAEPAVAENRQMKSHSRERGNLEIQVLPSSLDPRLRGDDVRCWRSRSLGGWIRSLTKRGMNSTQRPLLLRETNSYQHSAA